MMRSEAGATHAAAGAGWRAGLASPLGELCIVTDGAGRLLRAEFADTPGRRRGGAPGSAQVPEAEVPPAVARAFDRYFAGQLDALAALAVAPLGSAFQRRVWAALRDIPAGRTISYGQLARALGLDDPRAAIEVGAANGANPIAIAVPCHRVIASDGGLKGYAWGLPRKRWLLEHERAIAPSTADLPGF